MVFVQVDVDLTEEFHPVQLVLYVTEGTGIVVVGIVDEGAKPLKLSLCCIAIVHPEIGAECQLITPSARNNIWAHRKSLSSWPEGEFTTDDRSAGGGFIKIDDYVIQPALSCSGDMIEIGIFCHEFGHAFGLPDLY
ncbi:MAG: hypothetical protein D6722_17425, partial [Bacteroidetes bacterium]